MNTLIKRFVDWLRLKRYLRKNPPLRVWLISLPLWLEPKFVIFNDVIRENLVTRDGNGDFVLFFTGYIAGVIDCCIQIDARETGTPWSEQHFYFLIHAVLKRLKPLIGEYERWLPNINLEQLKANKHGRAGLMAGGTDFTKFLNRVPGAMQGEFAKFILPYLERNQNGENNGRA